MEKKFFELRNFGGVVKFNYEFCNGKSAKIKIENKLNGKVWYFPTGGNGYNFLEYVISNSISMVTGNAEGVRENMSMYEKRGNKWVEIDNTRFYRSTELFNNILIK